MKCEEAREMRHLYLDAEIGVAETPTLEAHLRLALHAPRSSDASAS